MQPSEYPGTTNLGKAKAALRISKRSTQLRRSEEYQERHPEGSTHFHSLTELFMLLGSGHCADDWEIAVD